MAKRKRKATQKQKQADEVVEKASYIMFDVKGEYACSDGLLQGVVKACGGMHMLVGVRVKDGGKGEAQAVDGRSLDAVLLYERLHEAAGAKEGEGLTTVELIGRGGAWVIGLLPLRQG